METESEEMNKQSQPDYYQDKHNRKKDTFLGIFSGITYIVFFFLLAGSLRANAWLGFLGLIIYIIAVSISFFNKRRYIGIGLISVVVIPLVIFGGCMLLFVR